MLAALDALEGAGGRRAAEPALLDRVLADAVALARDAAAARRALGGGDDALARALDDEAELARRLVIAVLALRHGERVRAAVRVIDHAEGERRALGIEALDVLALARRGRGGACRSSAAIRGPAAARRPQRTRAEWLDDLVRDPGRPLALAVARSVRRRGGVASALPRPRIAKPTERPPFRHVGFAR